MLTVIGKNEIRNAVSTPGPMPMPNQTIRMGTIAALGTALKPTSNGYSAAYAVRDEPTRKPSSTPTAMAIAKPTIVTQKVFQAASAIGAANSIIACTIVIGLGKMKSAIANTLHTSCHSASTAAAVATGAQRSSVLRFMAPLPRQRFRRPAFQLLEGEMRRCARAARARCR